MPACLQRKPTDLRVLRAAVLALLTALAGLAAPAASAAPDCTTQFLVDLGWRFVPGDGDTIDVHAGSPCDRASVAEARAAGDLVVRMPAHPDPALRARVLQDLLHHPATLCAYGFALGEATRRAIDRLVANPGFRFSGVQLGWIGFGASGSARDGWEPIAWFGRGYRPRGSNSQAIAGFYHGQVRGECGLGRQVAQYAAQAEMYGKDAFDAEFDADELVIGTFNRLHPTRSILLGTSAGTLSRDGRAIDASARGRQAFMGVPGFIFHVFDRSTLDDANNQAENFVVYDVSAPAATALGRHGGFEYYNDRSREAWALARKIMAAVPEPRQYRYFERLLYEHDATLRAALPETARAPLAQLDALLDDPFYRGFQVYVHRQGVKPVGFHIARLFDRNPRTPFRIELALHNVHTTLYDRYLARRIGDCGRGILVGTPASGSGIGSP